MKTMKWFALLSLAGFAAVDAFAQAANPGNPQQSLSKMGPYVWVQKASREFPVRIVAGQTNFICILWSWEDGQGRASKSNARVATRPLVDWQVLTGKVEKVAGQEIIIRPEKFIYKRERLNLTENQRAGAYVGVMPVVSATATGEYTGPPKLLKHYPRPPALEQIIKCYAKRIGTEDIPEAGSIEVWDFGIPPKPVPERRN